jgi:hypothetical protein
VHQSSWLHLSPHEFSLGNLNFQLKVTIFRKSFGFPLRTFVRGVLYEVRQQNECGGTIMSKKTKLSLNQETLRNLTRNELENVAGGFATRIISICQFCSNINCAVQVKKSD